MLKINNKKRYEKKIPYVGLFLIYYAECFYICSVKYFFFSNNTTNILFFLVFEVNGKCVMPKKIISFTVTNVSYFAELKKYDFLNKFYSLRNDFLFKVLSAYTEIYFHTIMLQYALKKEYYFN